VAAQDVADRGSRHLDLQLAAFSDDPQVAPARVLPGELEYELHGRVIEAATVTPLRVCPSDAGPARDASATGLQG